MIKGFPTYEEMKNRTLMSKLQTVVSRMNKVADLGETEAKFYDYNSIEGLLESRVTLEEMGYEVGFIFPDHLDIHKDEVFPSDISMAVIRWERRNDYYG